MIDDLPEVHLCAFCGYAISEDTETICTATWYVVEPIIEGDAYACWESDHGRHEPDLEAEADEEKDRQDEIEFAQDYDDDSMNWYRRGD
jgi:hypothetical protein